MIRKLTFTIVMDLFLERKNNADWDSKPIILINFTFKTSSFLFLTRKPKYSMMSSYISTRKISCNHIKITIQNVYSLNDYFFFVRLSWTCLRRQAAGWRASMPRGYLGHWSGLHCLDLTEHKIEVWSFQNLKSYQDTS